MAECLSPSIASRGACSSSYLLPNVPGSEARFQVSRAPGALRLAGSNRDETSPCGLLDESNLTFQQNSLDIDSIARKPAPKAKFQVSRAPGALTLSGSNRAETTGLIVTNRLREAATRLTTKFQRNSASRVTADMCLAANSVVLVRLFGIALLRRELCRAESRSRYLHNGSTKFT